MTFKEARAADISATFLNVTEFADELYVRYNGRDYNIPVIVDSDEERPRNSSASDNAAGLFASGVRVFIGFADLGILPNKNTKITIDGCLYNIIKSALEMGMIVLYLEELAE
jgi:hypothetical protein